MHRLRQATAAGTLCGGRVSASAGTGWPPIRHCRRLFGAPHNDLFWLGLIETASKQLAVQNGDQEIDRLLALGARRAGIGQTGAECWTVLADREGKEFCVVRPKQTLIR